MTFLPTEDALVAAGLDAARARGLLSQAHALGSRPPDVLWQRISQELLDADTPFTAHRLIYDAVFASWDSMTRGPRPAWTPTPTVLERTNIAAACERLKLPAYDALYRWSIAERSAFWADTIDTLGIVFRTPPSGTVDLSGGVTAPRWLPGAKMNITESCFRAAPDSVAIVYQREGGPLERVSVRELDVLSNRFANALPQIGFEAGDAVAIAMPMTVESVVAYIGIVKAGGVVVSVADSFSADEIETRLRIAGARLAVTQDLILRGDRVLPMYERVVAGGAQRIVVTPARDELSVGIRDSDVAWSSFLSSEIDYATVAGDPGDPTNVLFSSGTTGEPKAIPWSHTTPIKCAMDGHYHHDIHPGDVVAWPTNLGWMMGPWLIYAGLVNRATIALYYGAPNTPGFCRFVQDARVTMLGVVPSLVRAWRTGAMADGVDWSTLAAFSSTGEASNAEDMLWLMSRAGYKPVVEYCGGTEIGGGYITQTLVQPASPATFSTPALGVDVRILDEAGKNTTNGELFIVPPSIGLSLTLLNREHDAVYHADVPTGSNGETLRRHGDQMEALPDGFYCAHGRADDTMNLGGIKISSAEIERAANTVDGVTETAAIAATQPGGGPSRLVIYAVTTSAIGVEPMALKSVMQERISKSLNPLFRVHDVVVIDALPRTASNKVMRRVLRDRYHD